MRRASLLLALALVASCSTSDGDDGARQAADVSAYEGLGTWVDVYDYVPEFQQDLTPPDVMPESVDDMAALGVDTLYLQAAFADADAPDDAVVDADLVGEFLTRAHDHDLRVVAWYLPRLGDVDADLRLVEALHEFEADGERFDSIALDIEWTADVPDTTERNERLVDLTERSRLIVGEDALGAIVLPPVQLEVVNPQLWPEFPWIDLAPHYDVWLPMAYFTFRDGEHREAHRYVDESVRRLRANLDDSDASVHAIGGIADLTTVVDVDGIRRAVDDGELIGWSLYDYETTPSPLWPWLRSSRSAAG